MPMKKLAIALVVLAGCTAPASPRPSVLTPIATPTEQMRAAPGLPERLSDKDFWTLQEDISEPGGYFRIEDNYTSNEMEIGQLFSMLRDRHVSGDVYLGVGPEQNFTYIAAIRPRMAFIIDIRRQAAMQHLMFKALFEMAADRAEFISLLFAKPRPAGLDSATSIEKIWDAYRPVNSDSALYARTYARIVDRLTKTHGFTFTADESEKLRAVHNAFYYFGPAIGTRGYTNGRGGDFATLTGFSYDNAGKPQSFLSSEENYRYVKALHDRNLIVPVSGDFGGPKALRAIAAYLSQHGAKVRAFYVSNVEQYLFGDGKDRQFYGNVSTLPVDSASVFIRPYSMRRGAGGQVQSICPIKPFIAAALAGRVTSNDAALACVN
jgi:hypothetical protein